MAHEIVELAVNGIVYDNATRKIKPRKFQILVSNDETGKTLSIADGRIQFTFPFEPVEKYLR